MRIDRFVLSAALTVVLLSFAAVFSARADDFYDPPAAEIAGKPGSIIRAEEFAPPSGASAAYRVLYRSTAGSGRPIAVSGVVIVPAGKVPQGGRKIVSWAHATSGIARGCARTLYPNLYVNMYGLQDLLAQGVIVAATDYPGLGAPGVHPYLIGADQGHAVLDMARAARALPEARAGSDVAVAGYSQGGHAVLHAGLLARSYAPDLNLVAIAASAPPTDLQALIRETGDDPIGRVFATYAIASWSRLYKIPLDGVVEKRVRRVVNNIAGSCNMETGQALRLMFAEQAFEREGFLLEDVMNAPPWKGLMAKNSPGPTPAGIPVFLAQGLSDSIVRPDVTQGYADRLCARGVRVRLVPIKGGHREAGALSAKPMAAWLLDRFRGKPAPSDCGTAAAQVSARDGRPPVKPRPQVKTAKPPIPADRRFDVVDAESDEENDG